MVNKVILIGNLGRDPEMFSGSYGQVAKLSVATTKSWKNKQGDWQNETEWHKVVAFGFAAEAASKLAKGDQVYVDGSLSTNKYEKDGETKYSTEVKAQTIRKLGKKESSNDSGPHDSNCTDNTYDDHDNTPF
jgi:single-strand DNA-binding protein